MPRALRCLLAAGVVTALTVTGGLLISPDDAPPASAPRPSPSTPSVAAAPTTLADYDTSTVTVQRAPFCELVVPTALRAALGGTGVKRRDYVNGESAALTKRVTDIAHEYGCGWSTATASAHAWVFAPPVTRSQARRLVADAASDEACTRLDDAPAFGSPSVAEVCRTHAGLRTSYRGLFGDAWLACSLQSRLKRSEAVARTGELCLAVAQAASTPVS